MKKIISICISLVVAMSAAINAVQAQTENDIIIKADKSNFTYPDGTNVGGLGGDWAKDSEATYAVANYNLNVNTPDNTYITYKGMPKGEYDVYYYIAGSDNSDGKYRSSRALDSDVSVTDAYGTYTVESVRPYIGYKDYVNIGTYCFDGKNDEVKVTANSYDNRDVNWLGSRMLITHSIKLVPTDHSDLLKAINSADDVQAVEEAVKSLGGTYIDKDSLVYMGDVYKEILNRKPETGYENSHEIKLVADRTIESKLTVNETDSYLFIWAPKSEPSVYRNYSNVASLEDGGNAVIMFKNLPTGNVKNVELNFELFDGGRSTNAIVSKAAGNVYENFPSGQARGDINSVIKYTDMTESKYVASGFKDITDDVLHNAINENGELSLYMTIDDMGDSSNIRTLLIKPAARIKITYDKSDIAGNIDLTGTFEDGTDVTKDTEVSVGNKILTLKSEAPITDWDFLNDICVTSSYDVAFTAERVSDTEFTINFIDDLKYGCSYVIESKKGTMIENDSRKYTMMFSFKSERYPIEYSGITLMKGTEKITDIDSAKCGEIEAAASVINNTAGQTQMVIMVNLFERTADGVRMIESGIKSDSINSGEKLEFYKKFTIPDADGDYVIKSFVWNDFRQMSDIKFYNEDFATIVD